MPDFFTIQNKGFVRTPAAGIAGCGTESYPASEGAAIIIPGRNAEVGHKQSGSI